MNSILVLIAVCYLFSVTSCYPVQNGMIYYQPGYYDAGQHQQAYQQAMLLHYAQQPYYGRSVGAGMSAFATGEQVVAGTYLRDWDYPHYTENQLRRQHVVSASEQHETYDNSDDVSAFAEAYPAEPAAEDESGAQRQEEQTNEVLPPNPPIPVVENDDAQDAPVDVLPVSVPDPVVPEAQAAPAAPEVPAPVVPAVPLAPFPPKKPNKVHVELDTSAVADSEEDDDEDQLVPILPPKKRGKNNGNGAQPPPYSFFPNIFSDASGATIAVANAFSNGKGGARSHAIAYGSRGGPKRVGASKKRFADIE